MPSSGRDTDFSKLSGVTEDAGTAPLRDDFGRDAADGERVVIALAEFDLAGRDRKRLAVAEEQSAEHTGTAVVAQHRPFGELRMGQHLFWRRDRTARHAG